MSRGVRSVSFAPPGQVRTSRRSAIMKHERIPMPKIEIGDVIRLAFRNKARSR